MFKKLLFIMSVCLPVTVQAEVIDIPIKCKTIENNAEFVKTNNPGKLHGICNKYSLKESMDIHSSKKDKYYNYIYDYNYIHPHMRGDLYSWFGDFYNQITYNNNTIDYLEITKTNHPVRYKAETIPRTFRAMDFISQYYDSSGIPEKLINKPFIFTTNFYKINDKKYGLVIQSLVGKVKNSEQTYSELTPEQMDLFSQGNTLKIGNNYIIPSNAPGIITSIDQYLKQQNDLDSLNQNDDYVVKDVSIMNAIFDKLTQ